MPFFSRASSRIPCSRFSRAKFLEEGYGLYTADFCKHTILCTIAFVIFGVLTDPTTAFKTFIYTQIISLYISSHHHSQLYVYHCMNSWDKIVSVLFALRVPLFWKRSSIHLPIPPNPPYKCFFKFSYPFIGTLNITLPIHLLICNANQLISFQITRGKVSFQKMLHPIHKPFLFSNSQCMAKQPS